VIEAPDGSGAERAPTPGTRLLVASWAGTGLFTALAVAALFVDAVVLTFVALSLVMFAVGCVLFVVAFLRAVDRSRTETIGIGGLFFGAGAAPGRVQALLMGSLAVEVVVAVTIAVLRPYTALAFGTLAPMFPLGVAGLWVALFGVFPSREAELTRAGRRDAERAAHRRGPSGGTASPDVAGVDDRPPPPAPGPGGSREAGADGGDD
jgi:hypothetical protein